MKKCFMRAFWGINDNSNKILGRKSKVEKDIEALLKNEFAHEFVTYVFGDENQKYLKSKGIDSILIDKNPYKWDLMTCQYRHKLETLRWCMENDGYDEIVHLDWDCIPSRKIDSDFWKDLRSKEPFQACLEKYKRKKCSWRKEDVTIVPNGGFLYIRDKNLPSEVITEWEELKGPSAEPPLAKYLDDKYGKWIGKDEYFKLHEPEACLLRRKSVYSRDVNLLKRYYFKHNI